jgi:hypothetical protein
MKTGVELRAEAQRTRTFALSVTDTDVLAEIQLMIEELERRAPAPLQTATPKTVPDGVWTVAG